MAPMRAETRLFCHPSAKILHMDDEILDFIRRRFSDDCRWLCGNCLWFAHILASRFDGGRIVLDPVVGHFMFERDGRFYDWTGETLPEHETIALDEIRKTDELWYDRLIRDCWD